MSVLIKGMEMPTEGTVIAVYKIDGKLYATRGLSGRLCPLVPVPPHGRLIDAEELIKGIEADAIWKHNAINEYDSGIRTGARAVMRSVRNAPTIVPAEESDE